MARLYDDDMDTGEKQVHLMILGRENHLFAGVQTLHLALARPGRMLRVKKMMYASGVRMFFRILSCLSVRPPIWAGPDWTGFMFFVAYG